MNDAALHAHVVNSIFGIRQPKGSAYGVTLDLGLLGEECDCTAYATCQHQPGRDEDSGWHIELHAVRYRGMELLSEFSERAKSVVVERILEELNDE